MTGAEFRAIRRNLGCTQDEFGRLLGYRGNRNTIHLMIQRFENGRKTIPCHVARYVWLINCVYQNSIPINSVTGLPNWPKWPIYVEEPA